MNLFRVTYHLRGPVASAFQADTLFGHLCWAKRYLDGEEALDRDFLEWFRAGEPLLILSDGFPGDSLPNLIFPPPRRGPLPKAEAQRAFDTVKKAREARLLALEEFNRAINGQTVEPAARKPESRTRVTLKNQINRLTGTTGDGGHLFEFEEIFWESPVSIYVRVTDGFEAEAKRLFEFVAEEGYGKRKSVGYGAIRSVEIREFNGFKPPSDPSGFVSLSHFVPAPDDPRDGFWKVLIKYGKMGEEYAIGENPFKRPLVMLTPGSVFRTQGKPREFYGRLVSGVSEQNEKVVQYGFAFAVPMKMPPTEVGA